MILVTGATGFVGRHLVRAMRMQGMPVRALVRDQARAGELARLGAEIAEGDIADPAGLEQACSGAERIVHLVGIIQEAPGATFQAVHVEGTKNVLEAAKRCGARHFFYQSALGTRPDARSEYHRTKWRAEELVRGSGMAYTVLRPSLIYGPGDQFTLRLAAIIRSAPVLPVIGSGRSKVQPLFIDDLVACIIRSVAGDAFLNRTCEVGGPEQLTYEEVTRLIAGAMGIARPVVHMPLSLLRPAARLFEAVLPKPPVTTEQLLMLEEDNICSPPDACGISGGSLLAFREGLRRFLGPK